MQTLLHRLAARALLAGACFAAPAAQAAVDGAYSGLLYNPAQSGHGVQLEVISPTRAIYTWYVYDNQGRQMWLLVDGVVDGDRIEGPAYIARGMKFGSFDPDDNTQVAWGTARLQFSSCSEAVLSWNSSYVLDGYTFGPGSVPLTRLTSIDGSQCGRRVGSGLYSGFLSSQTRNRTVNLFAAFDEQGRLTLTHGDLYASQSGTVTVNGNTFTGTLTGATTPGLRFVDGSTRATFSITGTLVDRDTINATWVGAGEAGTLSLRYENTYLRGGALSRIAGNYRSPDNRVTVGVTAAGAYTAADQNGCRYTGTLAPVDVRFGVWTAQLEAAGCSSDVNGTYATTITLGDYFFYGDNRALTVSGIGPRNAYVLGFIRQ